MSKSVTLTGQYDRNDGAYKRKVAAHRHWVRAGGEFEPEEGRYHLHVALACPWACGTLTMLYEKGLEGAISHSVVHPTWAKTKPDDDADEHRGWVYRTPGQDAPLPNPLGHGAHEVDGACAPDGATGCRSIREVYRAGGRPDRPIHHARPL